ncbi:MAG: DNA-binding protein [Chloroflexi bacterium]|nr:DNA-binding protein [Chloroflexota bacterium]
MVKAQLTTPFRTMAEVAEQLGVSPQRIQQLVASGAIPSVRLSPRRVLIPAGALQGLADRAMREHADRTAR